MRRSGHACRVNRRFDLETRLRPRVSASATFGPGFETAQSVVAISVANALVSILGAPSITVMARSDMERRLLALSVAELVVMLVAGGLLVGPYGMVGVAIALLVAAVARAAVAVISIRRRYGIRPAVIL